MTTPTHTLPISFRKYKVSDSYAIFLDCFEQEYIVSPLQLFKTIPNREARLLISKITKENQAFSSERACIHITIEYEDIEWVVVDSKLGLSQVFRLNSQDYITCIRCILSECCNAVIKGAIIRGDNCTEENIKQLFNQLHIAVAPSVYKYNIDMKSVTVEKLNFSCEYDDYDITYILSIGDRVIKSYISEWSSDLEKIRTEIEQYIFSQKTVINLNFEDCPTEIHITKFPIRERAKEKEVYGGILLNWCDLSFLTILPNSFLNSAPIVGICNPRQVIKIIYEGLLSVADAEFIPNCHGETWGNHSNDSYKQALKSEAIENYIYVESN